MATKIKLGNGNWGVKDGGTLAYNDENGVFKAIELASSRASGATYVAESGLITENAIAVPRIDFSDSSDGALLLEPQRTNNVSKSFYEAGSPFALGPNISFVENVTSPDGSNNGARFVSNSPANSFIQIQSVTIPSGDFTFSMYIKGVEGSFLDKPLLVSGLSNVSMNETPIAGEDWKRVYGTGNNSGSSFSATIVLPFFDQPVNTKFDIFGFQLEQGNYPTSYIPTSGTTVTRIADAVTGNSSLGQVINSSEGVLYAEVNFSQQSSTTRYISLNDGTTNNRVLFGNVVSSNNIQGFIQSGGSIVLNTQSSQTLNQYNKIAVKWSVNDFALWVNGVEIGVSTTGSTPLNISQIDFDGGGGSDDFYGKVKDLRVYDVALSDEELQNLTTL